MSKEQTPIEELVEQIKLIHGAVPLEEEYLNRMIQKEKEFTQAKVLEALERDKLLMISSEAMKGLLSGGKYYQNQSEKDDIAYHSVKIAEALIKEVSKQK